MERSAGGRGCLRGALIATAIGALVVIGACVFAYVLGKSSLEKAVQTAATPSAPPRGTSPTPPRTTGGWQLAESRSPMDDSRIVVLSLAAENEAAGWLARQRPGLVIRCASRKTDVYVITGMSVNPELGLHEKATVTVRFDATAPRTMVAFQSTDDEALFLPGGVTLARQLVGAKRLVFEFTPFRSSPQQVFFDLAGLRKAIAPVQEACGWSTTPTDPSKTAAGRREASKKVTRTLNALSLREEAGTLRVVEVTDVGVRILAYGSDITLEEVWFGEGLEQIKWNKSRNLPEFCLRTTCLALEASEFSKAEQLWESIYAACLAWLKKYPDVYYK
ncbi:MAG: type VI secretion system-associated protein TagO [Vicinamibacteria bacterium]